MKKTVILSVLLAVFCFAIVIIVTLKNGPIDYGYNVNTTRAWLDGKTQLYDVEYVRYQYTPWTLLFYLPFSFLPDMLGKLLFNLISAVLLFWAAWRYAKPGPMWAYSLALLNVYSIMHFQLGQFDIIILAALTLGMFAIENRRPWLLGIAFVLITTKFTNVGLPLLVLLYGIHKWPRKDLVRVMIIPIGMFLLSFAMVGWDGLIRYIRLLIAVSQLFTELPIDTIFGTTTYKTSYWGYLNLTGRIMLAIFIGIALLILIRKLYLGRNHEFHEPSVFFALAINLVASPYVVLYHYVYLAPILARFLTRERKLGLLLLFSTVIDLILCYFRVGFSCFSLMALLVILVRDVYFMVKKTGDYSPISIGS